MMILTILMKFLKSILRFMDSLLLTKFRYPQAELLINSQLSRKMKKIVKNARRELWIVCPEITRKALVWLLKDINRHLKITILTTEKSHYKVKEVTKDLGIDPDINISNNIHAKILMNEHEAIVGSANVSYSGLWILGKGNIELGLYIRKREIISSLKSFIERIIRGHEPPEPIKVDGITVVYGPKDIKQLLENMMRSLLERLYVVSPYLGIEVIDWLLDLLHNKDIQLKFLTALRKGDISRGLTDPMALNRLLKCGAELRRHDTLHAKCIILDNKVGIIGTFNMTFDGIHENYEVLIVLEEESLVKELLDWYETLYSSTSLISQKDVNSIIPIITKPYKKTDIEIIRSPRKPPPLILKMEELIKERNEWEWMNVEVCREREFGAGWKLRVRIRLQNRSDYPVSSIRLHTSENMELDQVSIDKLEPEEFKIIEGTIQFPREERELVVYQVKASYYDNCLKRFRRTRPAWGSKKIVKIISPKSPILKILSQVIDELEKKLGRPPLIKEFKREMKLKWQKRLPLFINDIRKAFPELRSLSPDDTSFWNRLLTIVQLYRQKKSRSLNY